MRYFWLIFLAFFMVVVCIFAYQNQTPVPLRFDLDWINIRLGFAARPVFIPIFLSLAIGMLLAGLYLLGYHTRLRLQVRLQANEIYRLKKLVLLERGKHQKSKQNSPALPPKNSQPSPEESEESSTEQEAVLLPQEPISSENVPSAKI